MSDMTKVNGLSKLASNKDLKDKPIPTATMVISKTDAENIKYKYGVDILNNKNDALKIMKYDFLLNLAVVDEATETIFIFDESTKNYDIYKLSAFKPKGNKNTIDLKDLVPLLKR